MSKWNKMRRKQEAKDSESAQSKAETMKYVKYGVALLAVAVIIVVFFSGDAPEPIPDDHQDGFVGPEDATVVVTEFSDFECPACGAQYPIFSRIKEEYKDRVKFVYKDFPLRQLHPNAQKAAEAAECANEQGKFWEMHDTLFENQQSGLGTDYFKGYAADIGLDTEQFNNCLDSSKYASEVEADLQEGLSLGVNSTPSIVVNGTVYRGVQQYPTFKGLIEREL